MNQSALRNCIRIFGYAAVGTSIVAISVSNDVAFAWGPPSDWAVTDQTAYCDDGNEVPDCTAYSLLSGSGANKLLVANLQTSQYSNGQALAIVFPPSGGVIDNGAGDESTTTWVSSSKLYHQCYCDGDGG